MASYKFIYFNTMGKGETTRYMFKLKGVAFDDVRLTKEEWEKIKPSSPFGALPLLEVDGVTICQSRAIERLVAKRLGLYGSTDMEQAKTDMVIGCVDDIFDFLIKIYMAEGEEAKDAARKVLLGKLPTMLANLEKMVNENSFFISDKLMWADVGVAYLFSLCSMMGVEYDLASYPKIAAMKEKFETTPEIVQWVKEREKLQQ